MKDYIEQYKKLHSQEKYGTSSEKLYYNILPLVKEINPKVILDYGCGQSKLVDMLPCKRRIRYDPAIEKYSSPFVLYGLGVELVLCTDVLEHIPEEELKGNLVDIKLCSDNVIFVISTILAKKILPNGENAHCTVKPIEWWIDYLKFFYPTITLIKNIRNVKFICKTW